MKIKFRKYFFTVSLFSLCGFLTAQLKPGLPNDLDKKYVPASTQLFTGDANSSSGRSNSGSSVSDCKNAITINLALLPRSIFALNYERFLSEEISLQVSLGRTFGKDYGLLVAGLDVADVFDGTHTSSLSFPTIYERGVFESGGMYFAGSFKFHFGADYMSDNTSYLEVGLRSYSVDLVLAPKYDSGSPDLAGSTPVTITQMNYFLNYGFRFFTDGRLKTTHELYSGVGIRSTSYDVFIQQQSGYSPQYGTYYQNYKTGARENHVMPYVAIGYIFGFGF